MRVLAALEARRFLMVASEPMLAELAEVLGRPRIVRRYGPGTDARDALISHLRRRAVLVPITHSVQLCRDPDDNIVIETAALGRADTLVTRDDDLKGDPQLVRVLAAAEIEVLSVRRFLAALDENAESAGSSA